MNWIASCANESKPLCLANRHSTSTDPRQRTFFGGVERARYLRQQVYDVHCASCHGAELEGEADWRTRRADGTLPAPPHDASGHTWHHPDQQLFAITKEGIAAFAPPGYKTTMEGYAGILSDEEIWAVLDYIKSRWPEDLRARQADRTRRAGG